LHLVAYRLSRWLRPIYYRISWTGALSMLIPRPFRPRLIQLKTGSQEQMLIFWGNVLVGRYNGVMEEWIIRSPYRIIINKQILSWKYPLSEAKACKNDPKGN